MGSGEQEPDLKAGEGRLTQIVAGQRLAPPIKPQRTITPQVLRFSNKLGALARIVKYYATAFGMGALWFLALYPFAGGLPLGGELFPFDLLAMCLASLTIAATFRRRIADASRRTFILLSVFLPWLGAFIFGVFFVGFMAVQNVAHNGLFPDADALKIPIICVIYGAIGLCFVSVPMGLLSQYVMQRVSRRCA